MIVTENLISQLADAIVRRSAPYASGKMLVAPARSAVSRAYGRIWVRLPYMLEGVQGCGVYAVSAEGRARWGEFPDIISDDTFVRVQFKSGERVGVPAPYSWPLPEGFRNLVRVRRRADAGIGEIYRDYPELVPNEDKRPIGPRDMMRLAISMPVSFAIYVAVVLAARSSGWRRRGWSRGR